MRISEHIAAQVVYLVLVGEDELAECRGVAVLESVYTIEVVGVLHGNIIAEKTNRAVAFFLRREFVFIREIAVTRSSRLKSVDTENPSAVF
jgi:hypothetical protein